MALIVQRAWKLFIRTRCIQSRTLRKFSTSESGEDDGTSLTFSKAFSKFEELKQAKKEEEEQRLKEEAERPLQEVKPEVSFYTLLRNSPFMQLGDPEGRIVTGKIFHIVGDDLYIDFGGKFHCVCPRPFQNSQLYVRGATVKLKLFSLEMSSRFLGATKDLTLLEADAMILNLISTPADKNFTQKRREPRELVES